MPIDKPLEEITAADINSLVTDQERESRTLEFKRELYGSSDKDKQELCADVTSFANTSGGLIIIGVDEDKGVAVAAEGIVAIDPDKEILRVQQILRSGTRPALSSVSTHAISAPNGRWYLLVRIQRSWARPHAVANGDWLRWYARHSNGKYLLDVPELKAAFLISDSLAERTRSFRAQRLADIGSGNTDVPLPVMPKFIYHVIPADSFDPGVRVDLGAIRHRFGSNSPFSFATNVRFNLEGMLFYQFVDIRHFNGYVQVYDSGVIEAVVCRDPTPLSEHFSGGRQLLSGSYIESNMVRHVTEIRGVLGALSAASPSYLLVSIIGLLGRGLVQTDPVNRHNEVESGPREIQRDPMLLLDVVIENDTLDTKALMKPVFDQLWRSSGWSGSPTYGAN